MDTRTFESKISRVGAVRLPQFTGTRIMMMPFRLDDAPGTLPDFVGAWRDPISRMCKLGPAQEGVGYLTIDEAFVLSGQTHRRPGLHVDGIGPKLHAGGWGGGGGGVWGGGGTNPEPPKKDKKKKKPKVQASAWQAKQGMLVVASHLGCRGWDQTFAGFPGPNGDCAALSAQCDSSNEVRMEAEQVFWCSPLAVHESLSMRTDTRRQFVRISMPSVAPWYEGYTENPLGIKPTGPIHNPRTEFMAYRP